MMEANMDAEAPARAVERDIERTRTEMDATLSKLERRLAPSEIVQRGTETVRERVRGLATHAFEALQRHPVPVALAVGAVLARFALRPSAEQRLRLQADDDFDRAWRVLRAGMSRAKEQGYEREAEVERRARELASQVRDYLAPALDGASEVARRGSADAARLLQQTVASSRTAGRALREGSSLHPVATMALLGLAAMVGRRRWRTGY